jgi:adenylate cyclase
VSRHLAFPGARIYTPAQSYEKAGVDRETAEALWRAMGFPLVPEDEVAFTETDVEILRAAAEMLEGTEMDLAVVVEQARAMGQAAARVAAAQQDVVEEMIPRDDLVHATERALVLTEGALPTLDRLLVYMYRRHLAVASEQRFLVEANEDGGAMMSVGFADLSGFTELSQELSVRELARFIDQFNSTTSDVITELGGRLIKTIGDEVMFAALDTASAASISLRLVEDVSNTGGLPPLRVGMATGHVVSREGDLFGVPVNLAKRLVVSARKSTVLVDRDTRDVLRADESFRFTPLARRHVKGFGHVRMYRLRRAIAR